MTSLADGYEALVTAEDLWVPLGGHCIILGEAKFKELWNTHSASADRVTPLLELYLRRIQQLAEDPATRTNLPQVYLGIGVVTLTLCGDGFRVTFNVELREARLIITTHGAHAPLPGELERYLTLVAK